MMILFFLGVLFVMIVWNLYYQKNWDKNVTVHLDFAQDSVFVGEQANIIEKIENRKKLPLPVFEVSFQMRQGIIFQNMENTYVSDLVYKRDVFALLGHQRITRNLAVDCMKRGYYQIDKMSFSAFSLLYSNHYIKDQKADTQLYVYAKRVDISEILLTCEKIMGAMQCAKRLYEDPFAFASIREYTMADPMKTINWKASAKTGDLMVNTFDSTLTEKVMIYLDIEDKGILKYENLIEDGISVAATLSQKLLHGGMEVGICINARDRENKKGLRIEPASGKGQLSKIEQMLARRKTDEETTAFGAILTNIPQDSLVIVISKEATRNQKKIEAFLEKQQSGLWILPYCKNEDCDCKTTENIQLIKREVAEY